MTSTQVTTKLPIITHLCKRLGPLPTFWSGEATHFKFVGQQY